MSEETKKGIFDKEYSRRQFLKISGKGLAGVTMTAAMLSLFGCTQKEVDEGVVETIALPQGLLVANRAKCTGCQRCETNCSLANDGKAMPFIARLNVRDSLYFGEKGVTDDYRHGDGLYGLWNYGPKTCRQCKDAKCMAACPAKAISPDPNTGARVIDEKLCVGCGACTAACPWNIPVVDPETKKSTKCITCGACVAGCPTGALSIVEWKDIAAAV
ncbi:MAG: ferredoxin-like protein [Angelakisella sp.]